MRKKFFLETERLPTEHSCFTLRDVKKKGSRPFEIHLLKQPSLLPPHRAARSIGGDFVGPSTRRFPGLLRDTDSASRLLLLKNSRISSMTLLLITSLHSFLTL